MFTGLIEALGTVVELRPESPGVRLVVFAREITAGTKLGDSVAINGCCLTVVEADVERLSFQAGSETLSRTNLGRLKSGSRVNIERSLRLGDRLGGHMVSGHIDAIGSLTERRDEGDWSTFWFSAPNDLMRQVAAKGSIAVDGVSLTVVDALDDRFSVALIPHTLGATTLGQLSPGDAVNLESDMLAKYVARLDATRVL
jgi:riboflavin synthase